MRENDVHFVVCLLNSQYKKLKYIMGSSFQTNNFLSSHCKIDITQSTYDHSDYTCINIFEQSQRHTPNDLKVM